MKKNICVIIIIGMIVFTNYVISPVSGDEYNSNPAIYIKNPLPKNNSIDVNLFQSNVSVYIEVMEIDSYPSEYVPFLWEIGGDNITTNSSTNPDGYGRIEANITNPLMRNETYEWYVNVSAIQRDIWKNESFSFKAFQEGPVANFTSLISSWMVVFNGSDSYDPDGIIKNYTWYFGDGHIGYGETIVHIYAADNDYNVSLNVTDNGGKHDNITKTIHIFNKQPVANFTNLTQGLKVHFDGTISEDEDGKIVDYRWEFGDGNNNTGTNASIIYIYEEDGSYKVNLTVTDDYGKTDNKSVIVNVSNMPPIADFDFDVNVDEVTFVSQSTDVDGAIINHTWTFGDGSFSYDVNPVHTYPETGKTYIVTLNVTDNKGITDEISKEVTTVDDTTNPTVKIIKPVRGLYFNDRLILPRLFRLTKIIGDITIEVEATDDESGIDKVEFYIGSDVFTAKAPDNNGMYTYRWERDRIRLIHLFVISVKAVDNAGNEASTKPMLVKKIL